MQLNRQSYRQKISHERGAIILEFALVAGIFFFALLALFDFSRYFALRAILTKGAQHGLEVAKVIDGLRIDTRRLEEGCTDEPGTAPFKACVDANYQTLVDARTTVINAATNLSLATFASLPNSGGNLELNAYEIVDSPSVTPTQSTTLENLSAIVIRPGEAGQNTTTGEIVDHPQICPLGSTKGDPNCTKGNPRQPTESLNGLYRVSPIVVQVQASFKPLFPFWNPFPVEGAAVGYRELNTGVIEAQLPPALACQNPPTCVAPLVLTAACSCECDTTQVSCTNGFTANPATCACECDSSQVTCPARQTANPTTCACECSTQGSAQSCKDAVGAPPESTLQWTNCQCSCPTTELLTRCNAEGKGVDTTKCICVEGPAETCNLSAMRTFCSRLSPPRELDEENCRCAEHCTNPIRCDYNGRRVSCDNCWCPTCESPYERQRIGNNCGPCTCPASSDVMRDTCPEAYPIRDFSSCECRNRGGDTPG